MTLTFPVVAPVLIMNSSALKETLKTLAYSATPAEVRDLSRLAFATDEVNLAAPWPSVSVCTP